MSAKRSPSASEWATKFDRPATAPTPTKDAPETPTASRRRSARKPTTDSPRQKPSQKPEKPRTRTRKAPIATEPAEPAPAPPAAPPAAPVATRRRPPAKRAVTYRLADEILDLIDAAVGAAAERGERLTKEEAVATAIRRTYNRLMK